MTDLVELFRAKTNEAGWGFDYGRKDFHNLAEAVSENDSKWYFFLDPITTDDSLESKVVSLGYFMLLSKSDLDQVYDGQKEQDIDNGKFRLNILPKKQYLRNEFKKLMECEGDLEINKMIITDVINFFDDNMDGVLVNFTIIQYP